MRDSNDVRLRMDGLFELKQHALHFVNEFTALYTNGPAGGGGIRLKEFSMWFFPLLFCSRVTGDGQVYLCTHIFMCKKYHINDKRFINLKLSRKYLKNLVDVSKLENTQNCCPLCKIWNIYHTGKGVPELMCTHVECMLSDVDPSGVRELSGPSQATGSHHKLAKLSTKAFIQKLLRLIYFILFCLV